MTSTMPTAFFAYPTQPKDISELIENTINRINDDNVIHIRGWKEIPTTGNVIIDEVCEAIDDSDLFMCDVSYLSANVLFELGYAIAKNKKIWICYDASLQNSRNNLKKLGILESIGYTTYENSYELRNKFFSQEPYNDLQNTPYIHLIQAATSGKDRTNTNKILYLKSEFQTEASVLLSSRLSTARLSTADIQITYDDPQEASVPPLSWYVQNSYDSVAVIAHLTDEGRFQNSKTFQNSKYHITCGMAYGFGRNVLMLAHDPYKPSVDFRNLLQIHTTAEECVNIADRWIINLEKSIQDQHNKRLANLAEIATDNPLHSIDLGEFIAENESEELPDYFMPTSAYDNALKNSQTLIYVGRKGSGKTANLLTVASKLEDDVRNHICIIKPVDYEFEGILRLFSSRIADAEQGYFTESLWKFLVYTQLASSVYNDININRLPSIRSQQERDFILYVERHKKLILEDFTIRMENAIERLLEIDMSTGVSHQRTRVSEALHGEILSELRSLLGRVLEDKQRVCILVDNLDKAWWRKNDLTVLADFIFGLLSVSEAISKEFQKTGMNWRKVNLSILLFIRSDIYSFISSVARESDKLIITRIDWSDATLLYRIIEERIVTSLDGQFSVDEVWTKFFARNINGVPVKQFLYDTIIPRPRDMIFLCKSALANAINRRHTRIEEDDIFKAIEDYSQHAFSSLLTETETQFENIEAFLYEFAGINSVVTKDSLITMALKANIPAEKHEQIIEALVDTTFLGLETSPDTFVFVYEYIRKKVYQTLARKTAENTGSERYKIHPAFYNFLAIVAS